MWWFGLVVLGNLLAFEVDFITAELQHLNVLEEVPSCNENRKPDADQLELVTKIRGFFTIKWGIFSKNV